MITYEWYFNDLMVKPQENGLQNVLYIVYWQLKGTNPDGVFGEQRGSCSLPAPNAENFQDYNTLTKSQVENWVETAMGYNTIVSLKQSIAEQIKMQTNPPFVPMPSPWE